MRRKTIQWNAEKSAFKKQIEAISFEDCLVAIEENRILDDIPNPRNKNQRILILNIANYAVAVPYVEDDEGVFLKTLYKSRKYTKIYLMSEVKKQ